jgi:nucleoside-diphosphate-sugar epimerase
MTEKKGAILLAGLQHVPIQQLLFQLSDETLLQSDWLFIVPPKYLAKSAKIIRRLAEQRDLNPARLQTIADDAQLLPELKKKLKPFADVDLLWFAEESDETIGREGLFEHNVSSLEKVSALGKAFRKIRAIHFLSSIYIAGQSELPFGEPDLNTGQTFRSLYEESKFLAERYLRSGSLAKKLILYRKGLWLDTRSNALASYSLNHYYQIDQLRLHPHYFPIFLTENKQSLLPLTAISDFAALLNAVLQDSSAHVGNTYHLVVPVMYSQKAVARLASAISGRRMFLFEFPPAVAKILSRLNIRLLATPYPGFLPGKLMNRITLERFPAKDFAWTDIEVLVRRELKRSMTL